MPKKSKPGNPTRLDRAREIGVSIPTLDSWSRCGVDVFDDAQVKDRLTRMRTLPPTLKPKFQPKIKAKIKAPSEDDPTQIDIESIIRQLSNVTDKHQAQTVKTQIDGLLNAYKLREAAGKYVSKVTVEEAFIRIGAAVKSSILRMEADLPPMLHGADPATMQKIIRGKVDEIMKMLSEAQATVWQHEETNREFA